MNNGRRLAVLDGIRGIAIIMVLCHHAISMSYAEPTCLIERIIYKIGFYCRTGVDLFFVLSGFLITGILLRSKESPRYYQNFYLRRTLRIFPLYYLYISLVFFVFPILSKYIWFIEKVSVDQIWYWTYLANFKMFIDKYAPRIYLWHIWSLCIEEQFYFIWPPIVGLFSIKNMKRVLVGIIFLCLGIRILLKLVYNCNNFQINVFTFGRFDILALGGLLAILYKNSNHNFAYKFKRNVF